MHRDPGCGCCEKWAAQVRQQFGRNVQIIDDAHRDSRSILAGPLRDIALIGAFRKGKQAERVSYETAIMLAELIERPSFASTLTECRDEEAAADERLAALLIRTVEPAK